MVPICYEQSLPNGPATNCAEFMATATEQYIKTVVGQVLSKTRSNLAGAAGAISIITQSYKRQLQREEDMLLKGEVTRGVITNLLPVETREASARSPLGMGDFRIALSVGGDSGLGSMPTIVKSIMSGYPEGVLEGYGRHSDKMDEDRDEEDEMDRGGPRVNGILTNGIHVNGATSNDNESYGWEGGGAHDLKELFGNLDQLLAVGQ